MNSETRKSVIATGNKEYEHGNPPVTGYGFSWTEEELNIALAESAKVVFDDSGRADISSLLSGLAETDFEKSQVERILSDTKPPEDWRVGEALAESYLVYHKDCYFPWPDGRDERKTGSSLPGADLVGFEKDGEEDFFAFGEVKTSSENSYPPGTMHGRTGLKKQIEDLKDKAIKDDLVRYLAHRAITASWKNRYINAAKKYIKSNTNVRIFGILIRDVRPSKDDLRARVDKLSHNAHTDMIIELLSIYLPAGSISALSLKVMNCRTGGVA